MSNEPMVREIQRLHTMPMTPEVSARISRLSKQLIDNWEESHQKLLSEGYEKICTAMAGEHSGTTYLHPVTLKTAYINVIDDNRITYKTENF